MIGLLKGLVELSPYDEEWFRYYDREVELLRSQVGTYFQNIYHFGSTAVVGLTSKPIIDMAMGVESADVILPLTPELERLDYEYHGEFVLKGSYFFSKGNPTTSHLHVVEDDSLILKRWLYFRDRLRTDRELAASYVALKQDLQRRFPRDRDAYGKGKDQFIAAVVAEMGKE